MRSPESGLLVFVLIIDSYCRLCSTLASLCCSVNGDHLGIGQPERDGGPIMGSQEGSWPQRTEEKAACSFVTAPGSCAQPPQSMRRSSTQSSLRRSVRHSLGRSSSHWWRSPAP